MRLPQGPTNKWDQRIVLSSDIDGVLIDATRRLSMCINGSTIDWKCFLDCNKLYLDSPKINNIDFINYLYNRGFKIVLVTGRPETMRECTERQLSAYNVVYEDLFMRPSEDARPDPVYKTDAILRLLRSGLDIAAHFDDNLETVKALRRSGIESILLY